MRPAADQQGCSLIEVLVAMVLTAIVFAAAVAIFDSFLKDSGNDARRTETQAAVRTAIDRISRELRTAVAPAAGSALIEYETNYDLVFREVSATSPVHQMRVRYCLDGNETLWRQTKDLQTTSDAIPSTSACPASAWATRSAVLGGCTAGSVHCVRVTNELSSSSRPLFTFGPTGWTSLSDIKLVEVTLYADENPGGQPGPTELTSGIYLRNDLEQPSVPGTGLATVIGKYVSLNGSGAYDPNGQALSYQWYLGGSCPSPPASDQLSSGGTSQEPGQQGPFSSGTQLTYTLVVTDTAGLTGCNQQTVTVS
jgi:prepilin-type N-terminal cleavage/methylation domain-containing protein